MFYPPAIGNLTIALTCAVLAFLARRGGLPRSALVGIRTRSTLRSDAAWDAGHRAAVPVMVAMALSSAAHAAALVAVELLDLPEAAGHVLAVSGFVVALALAGLAWHRADAAARRH